MPSDTAGVSAVLIAGLVSVGWSEPMPRPAPAPLLTAAEAAARARRWMGGKGGLKRNGAETATYVGMLVNDPCAYCSNRREIDIDHIVPVGLGGSHGWDNLTAACSQCNQTKRRHSLLWMVAEMGRSELRSRELGREIRRIQRTQARYPETFNALRRSYLAAQAAAQAAQQASHVYLALREEWASLVQEQAS